MNWLTRPCTRQARDGSVNLQKKMNIASHQIEVWKNCLVKKVEAGGLYSRNPVAHKWKCTYRSWVLHELVYWRLTDLLDQVILLTNSKHILGARILLRSSFETVGILIYLNQKTEALLEEKIDFLEFNKITAQLMLGSKNKTTKHSAINIVTVLSKWCERKYPGVFNIYSDLCESAHPNYEGVCWGYSYINEKELETHFENRWAELYEDKIEKSIIAIMQIFEHEYNEVFPEKFRLLEKWIEANDEKLENEKSG